MQGASFPMASGGFNFRKSRLRSPWLHMGQGNNSTVTLIFLRMDVRFVAQSLMQPSQKTCPHVVTNGSTSGSKQTGQSSHPWASPTSRGGRDTSRMPAAQRLSCGVECCIAVLAACPSQTGHASSMPSRTRLPFPAQTSQRPPEGLATVLVFDPGGFCQADLSFKSGFPFTPSLTCLCCRSMASSSRRTKSSRKIDEWSRGSISPHPRVLQYASHRWRHALLDSCMDWIVCERSFKSFGGSLLPHLKSPGDCAPKSNRSQ
mmetsp:Transcript_79490/g.219875  ORF Transcript_79490/g.219875 Transcript_79490/m.219875 type:complete len:260 (+) Transcript_79490:163-942(+)